MTLLLACFCLLQVWLALPFNSIIFYKTNARIHTLGSSIPFTYLATPFNVTMHIDSPPSLSPIIVPQTTTNRTKPHTPQPSINPQIKRFHPNLQFPPSHPLFNVKASRRTKRTHHVAHGGVCIPGQKPKLGRRHPRQAPLPPFAALPRFRHHQ